MEHIKYKIVRLSRHVPENPIKGGVRNFVRRIKLKKHKKYLRELDKIIVEINEKNNYLYLTLKNGLKYCAPEDLFPTPKSSTIQLEGFRKINKNFYNKYNDFFLTLIEHFIKKIYPLERIVNNSKGAIIDCGAHIGVFTVLAAKRLSSGGKVVAIEIDDRNLKALRENLKLNKIKNVLVIRKGVYSFKKKSKFYFSKTRASMHSLVQSRSKEAIEKTVEIDRLDNILLKNRIKEVRTIKLDVEGAEAEALKGMKETMLKNNVQLLLGTHVLDGKHTLKDCKKILSRYNYWLEGTKYPEIFFGRKSSL